MLTNSLLLQYDLTSELLKGNNEPKLKLVLFILFSHVCLFIYVLFVYLNPYELLPAQQLLFYWGP